MFIKLLFLLLPSVMGNILLSSVSADEDTISITTSYLFQIVRLDDSNPIPANTQVLIYFPNAYTGGSIAGCQSDNWQGDPILDCDFAALKLTVKDGFTTDTDIASFNVRVTGITNPFPAATYSPFTVSFLYPNATEESGLSSVSLTITAGVSTCASTLTDGVVSNRGTIDITYTSTYITDPTADNYQLKILMAQSYPTDPVDTDVSPTLNISSTQLSTYLFSTTYTTQFSITLLMPPSTEPEPSFISIRSFISEGQIDECTVDISDVQPNVFKILTVSIAQVQSTSNLVFNLQSSSPLIESDIIVIDFTGTGFDVSGVNSVVTFSGGISGTRTVDRSGSTLSITSLASFTIVNTVLTFTINNIVMPFTSAEQTITFSIQTGQGYLRDSESYSYVSDTGSLTNVGIQCNSLQIGESTVCKYTFTTANTINIDDSIVLIFPNGFSITNGNGQYQTDGNNINPKSTYTTIQTNNTISITDFTSLAALSSTTITITVPTNLPSTVDTFNINIRTYSDGEVVDEGSVSLVTSSRALTDEINISAVQQFTSTLSNYTIQLSIPIDLGIQYVLEMQFPFVNVSAPSVNSNSLSSSFNSPNLTINGVTSGTLNIGGFQTHSSTQPITVTGELSYNSIIYFTFAYDIAIPYPREPTTFSYSSSSQKVGSPFIATFFLTDLAAGDKLILSDTQYYHSSQTDCSTNCICHANGTVEVLTVSASTEITFNMVNAAYQTSLPLNITSYQSTGLYKKQTKQFTMEVTELNTISIDVDSTNPYYLQQSTYYFSLTLSTSKPSAASVFNLEINIPSSYDVNSLVCLVGCNSVSNVGSTYYIGLTSTNVRIQADITNPSTFLPITFKTTSIGDMDYGEYTPETQCNLPCRSCTTVDSCLSCYSWANENKLRGGTCVSECEDEEYHSETTSQCLPCDFKCAQCSSTATNCQSCHNPYKYYEQSCVVDCPSDSYPDGLICVGCQSNCVECTSGTVCVQCDDSSYLYLEDCYNTCPTGTYVNIQQTQCLDCVSPCTECNRTYCFQCLSTHIHFGGACHETCPDGSFADTNTSCQECPSTCTTCDQSECFTCGNGYVLYVGDCVNVCPEGRYNDGITCSECAEFCGLCVAADNCTTCVDDAYFYGYECMDVCPNGTTTEDPYCLSESCQLLSNCKTCSNLRCLHCDSGYTLNTTTNSCVEDGGTTTTVNGVSEIPVPFPFIIASIVIITMGFLIHSRFKRMFAPFFIYALCGLAEVGVMVLWIMLMQIRGVSEEDQMGVLLMWIGTGVAGIYVLFNFVGFILHLCLIRADRKYQVWQKQDNCCCSAITLMISTTVSFRFALIQYSRLGHLESFSAVLSSDRKLLPYNVLAICSIVFICIPNIVFSAWVCYLQSTMNYLFFTSIENGLMAVLIIVFVIAQLVAPKNQMLQTWSDYKPGQDSDSIEVMVNDVIEEQYHENKEIISAQQDEVMRRNQPSDEFTEGGQTSEPFIVNKKEDDKLSFDSEFHNQILNNIEQKAKLQSILGQAEKIAQNLDKPTRLVGRIMKQILESIDSEQSSEGIQSSEEEQVEQFIDGVRFSFNPKKKRNNIIEEDKQMQFDQDKTEQNERMEKVKELLQYLEEQDKHEKLLREKLELVTAEEKRLKEKEYQQAQQAMERNRMSVEDKLSRLHQIFQRRKQKQMQRKEKLAKIQEERNQQQQIRFSQPIQLHDLVYNPVQEDGKDSELKQIKVTRKDPLSSESPKKLFSSELQDDEWEKQPSRLPFQSNKKWQMQEETIFPVTNRLKQDRQDSLPNESKSEYDHWPIDPETEQKIIQTEKKAEQYIRQTQKEDKNPEKSIQISASRIKYFQANNEIDQGNEEEINDENLIEDRNQFIFENQEEDEEENSELPQHPSTGHPIINKLELESKIKVPKGRVNRDVIILSPGRY